MWRKMATLAAFGGLVVGGSAAGRVHTVHRGDTLQLDASATTDPDDAASGLTYLWDLNENGIYGETGSAAAGSRV